MGTSIRSHRRPRSTEIAAVVLLLVAGSLAACGGGSDKAGGQQHPPAHVLTLVNPRSSIELQPFLHTVDEVAVGVIAVDAHNDFESESLQNEADAIRLLQSGRADLAIIPSRAFDGFGVTSFDALSAPMEIDNMALQGAVLSSDIATDMLAGVEPLGLVGLGILPGPMRVPAGITRPLVVPADYRGARIGVSPSRLAERSLRAIGAVPVETPFEHNDIGGFDGIENQVVSIAGNQYDRDVRWITANVSLWPRPLVVVASRRTYAALSDAERGKLREVARAAQGPTMAVQLDLGDAVPMCRRHVVRTVLATPAEVTELRRAFDPVYRSLRTDSTTADLLDRIDRIKGEGGPTPEEIFDCGRLVPATGSRSPGTADAGAGDMALAVDGNYLQRTTRDDLIAMGDDPDIPENWGEMRLSLDRGRFVMTQRNATVCTWGYGTYLLHGATFELTFTDGGGLTPTGSVNKPGEDFTYALSVYRGTMRWSVVPDALSPPPWAYKPWARKGDAPAREFVDRRCHPPDAAFAH